uniref:Uncharacterized protein n=1 Tax=Nelumbo nucifera TaxID=4432 RepID=A0A822ZCR3_NELNU|nr:TPA_asm: hypothetical protein HUJ06_000927 [Nelumbo nucifera]
MKTKRRSLGGGGGRQDLRSKIGERERYWGLDRN